MNKVRKILLVLLIPLLFILARNAGLFEFKELIQNRNCSDEQKMEAKEWKGEVIDKFRDSNNHNIKTLIIRKRDGTIERTTFLMLDISGAYNYIQIGDRIIKTAGSRMLWITNDSTNYQIELDYDCNKEE